MSEYRWPACCRRFSPTGSRPTRQARQRRGEVFDEHRAEGPRRRGRGPAGSPAPAPRGLSGRAGRRRKRPGSGEGAAPRPDEPRDSRSTGGVRIPDAVAHRPARPHPRADDLFALPVVHEVQPAVTAAVARPGQLRGDAPRPAIPPVGRRDIEIRRHRGPRNPRGLSDAGGGPQPGHPVPALLPGGVLPAVAGRCQRRDLPALAADVQQRRGVQRRAGSVRDPWAHLDRGPVDGAVHADTAERLDVRRPHDHLPGRSAADSQGALRSRRGGRRGSDPALLQRVAADAVPAHLLQHTAHDGERPPGIHPGVRGEQRHGWAGGLHAVLHPLPLPARLHPTRHGLRGGDGVGARPGPRRLHRRHVRNREVLGPLRRRMMSTSAPPTARPVRALSPIFPRRPSRSRLVRGVARHILLILVLFVVLYPLLWMVSASLRPANQTFGTLGLWPSGFTLDNYRTGWNYGTLQFSRYFLNSLVISVLCIIGNILSCSLAAYAFARLEFPFKRVLFAFVLMTLLLPYQATLVPQYVLFNHFAWINTILPLVVPKYLP